MDDFFNEEDLFEDNSTNNDLPDFDENEKGFFELLHRALEAKQSDFKFIGSWEELTQAKIVEFSFSVTTKMFKKLYKSAYKTYVKNVLLGIQTVETLIIVKQLKQCMEYYQKEVEIVKDMINEYNEYVWSGHIIDTLLGKPRSEEDFWDHRGRGKNGK